MNELHSSLPESFLQNMREMLGREYESFLSSYQQPTRRGLRFNLLKTPWDFSCENIPRGIFASIEGGGGQVEAKNIPWCTEGRQYPQETRPAKSPLYNAGLYYIQEPSAMCPATVLSPKPGQRVLDLCAAPGGKSAQLAGHMQGQGLLVSNDASPSRSRALVKNLEMAGVTNAIVLTEMPHRLAEKFEGFFDCILVDAPCSGEGMFRRDPEAAKAYTANKPEACGALQQEILHHAARMLKPGGRMVYSTCTFNKIENEGSVSAFLAAHPDFELLPIDHVGLGLSPGMGDLHNTGRIWPHKAPGEGHFIALMAKRGGEELPETAGADCAPNTLPLWGDSNHVGTAVFPSFRKGPRLPEDFFIFCEEALHIPTPATATKNKDAMIYAIPMKPTGGDFSRKKSDMAPAYKLYYQPIYIDLKGLRVARSGWLLGECAKGRFTPSQAFAMGITKAQAKHSVDLTESDAQRYLKGESLIPAGDLQGLKGKPWILVCCMGFPLGWARLVQGRLKNQLPTGWVV
ncbi:MAG: RsmB/NOP family class I SAM-dependent RNA methyltransferase [Defluviitaleaceae bacterium]|nr:RsmB/NOP family class I SAM-dependent RNA methyltransferase [Defluviitaleaceae bacterium]